MAEIQPQHLSNVTSGIYAMYRGISDQKLALDDVYTCEQDEATELVADLENGWREQRTAIADVVPEYDSDIGGYVITVENAPDFIPRSLAFASAAGVDGTMRWYDVRLLNFESYDDQFRGPGVSANFYGSSAIQNGVRVRINQSNEWVGQQSFRLAYKVPLYSLLQQGDVPPFPGQFIPFFKIMAGLRCKPFIRDDSPEFLAWFDYNLKNIWTPQVNRGMKLWTQYRDDSGGPTTALRPRWDGFRNGNGRMLQDNRAFWPRTE